MVLSASHEYDASLLRSQFSGHVKESGLVQN